MSRALARVSADERKCRHIRLPVKMWGGTDVLKKQKTCKRNRTPAGERQARFERDTDTDMRHIYTRVLEREPDAC